MERERKYSHLKIVKENNVPKETTGREELKEIFDDLLDTYKIIKEHLEQANNSPEDEDTGNPGT